MRDFTGHFYVARFGSAHGLQITPLNPKMLFNQCQLITPNVLATFAGKTNPNVEGFGKRKAKRMNKLNT
jgi:hypothetical protein